VFLFQHFQCSRNHFQIWIWLVHENPITPNKRNVRQNMMLYVEDITVLTIYPLGAPLLECVDYFGGPLCIPPWVQLREYWMIYRGPGFLGVVCFDSSTIPTPPSAICLNISLCCRSNLLAGGEEEGMGKSQSYDAEKALSSINQSIFSAATHKEKAWRAVSLREVQETEPIMYM
jgi:hypothetical protein